MVRDGKGDIVYGLHAQDFSIEDDGVQQAVHLDEAAEAVPVSLVIAVQTGRRAWREFARMRDLASMLDPVLSNRNNQAALLLFQAVDDAVERCFDLGKVQFGLRQIRLGLGLCQFGLV